MPPLIAADKDEIRTAPAAISLIDFTLEENVGLTRSHKYSTNVLKHSRLKTTPRCKTITIHSHRDMEKTFPKRITTAAIPNWILRLRSVLTAVKNPLSATLKLSIFTLYLDGLSKLLLFIVGTTYSTTAGAVRSSKYRI